MSGEIEFLDLEPASEPAERTASSAAVRSAGAVLGWTAGAALAVATAVERARTRQGGRLAPGRGAPYLGLAGTIAGLVAAHRSDGMRT